MTSLRSALPLLLLLTVPALAADPLPSWNSVASKCVTASKRWIESL